jgi:hypothetical protein
MAFLFRLQTADGAPADPPKLDSAVPNWRAGDTIPLGARTLRVVDVRYDEADDASAPSFERESGKTHSLEGGPDRPLAVHNVYRHVN